jgi:hypothetical protein
MEERAARAGTVCVSPRDALVRVQIKLAAHHQTFNQERNTFGSVQANTGCSGSIGVEVVLDVIREYPEHASGCRSILN